MNKETRELINAYILNFVNHYLKGGSIVKSTDAFYGRADLEKIIREVYEIGLNDGILAKTKVDKSTT